MSILKNEKRKKQVRAWVKAHGITFKHLQMKVGVYSPAYFSAMVGKKAHRNIPEHVWVKITKYFKVK